MARTVGELLDSAAPVERGDAEWLLADVLGVTRSELALRAREPVPSDTAARFEALAARRAAGEPLQYVLGEWGFRRLTLTVDRRALIPRPETEVVVERCLALLAGRRTPRVLDVGTGTGAIALAVADECPGAEVTGLDVSTDALALARENAERTGVGVEFLLGDVFAGLPDGPWDLVVSNPPYVDPDDRPLLAAEVRDWEPPTALFGRDVTEAVAREARRVLVAGGSLVLEVGDGQADDVVALLAGLGYGDVATTPDLSGRDRVVEGTHEP